MTMKGTSLLGQELRLSAAPAGGKDSILDLELSFPHAMWCGKKKKKKRRVMKISNLHLKYQGRAIWATDVHSVQFSSVAQWCSTLCDPMGCSMPGLPVQHQLPEFAQTHVHRVGDVIQPCHPLLSPSTPSFNLSQHQGLFE